MPEPAFPFKLQLSITTLFNCVVAALSPTNQLFKALYVPVIVELSVITQFCIIEFPLYEVPAIPPVLLPPLTVTCEIVTFSMVEFSPTRPTKPPAPVTPELPPLTTESSTLTFLITELFCKEAASAPVLLKPLTLKFDNTRFSTTAPLRICENKPSTSLLSVD